MFRGYSGPYCCEIDASAPGFAWRVVLASDPDQHLARGTSKTMDEAVKAAYAALDEIKGQHVAE